jgi:hypothetical protein
MIEKIKLWGTALIYNALYVLILKEFFPCDSFHVNNVAEYVESSMGMGLEGS